MLNLQHCKRVVVLGGGTAGWFAALTLRRMFSPNVEVRVIESPAIGIIGVGEGGLLNLVDALKRNHIDIDTFVKETGAAYKLGFSYEGWRTGAADDRYYHPFATTASEESKWYHNNFFPLISAAIHQNIPLTQHITEIDAIERHISQAEATMMLAKDNANVQASYHFDSHRVAQFLQKIAVDRGVIHQQGKVDHLRMNAEQHVSAVCVGDEVIDTDFLIDATGFARVAIGKQLQSEWCSFKDYLLLDSAIPFHMPHPFKAPYLLTRAIAMKAGWMWQIPLQHRVGAGYVFSSQHTTDAQALDEIQAYLGFDIEAMKTIRFEPGYFKQVWQGNIMAIGLASGFVEPLEATSIGQMLEQLRNLEQVLRESHGIIAQSVIDGFNVANGRYWEGIRDFLRMHYDCPRRDTSFWQAVAETPYPASYASLKQCWQQRTPRFIDLEPYALSGWQNIFHVHNWMFVGVPLGVIPPVAAQNELLSLDANNRARVNQYVRTHSKRK